MAGPEPVAVRELPITLGRLLKWLGVVRTGGEVKHLLATGGVRVNGLPEARRGRKLYAGDQVELPGGRVLRVEAADGVSRGSAPGPGPA